jgi:hypothetical protein
MNPTRAQLDAALPRVPAGIPAMCGDLTDPEERAVALDFGEKWIAAALRVPRPMPVIVTFAKSIEAVQEFQRQWTELFSTPETAQDSPQASAGGSEGTQVPPDEKSPHSAWGPPRPGTHESDVNPNYWTTAAAKIVDNPKHDWGGQGGLDEYIRAGRWSQVNRTPDTPTED